MSRATIGVDQTSTPAKIYLRVDGARHDFSAWEFFLLIFEGISVLRYFLPHPDGERTL